MSTEFGLFLLFLACVLAGGLGALVRTWSLRRWTLDLDMRVTDLEQKMLHEVKTRAGHDRWAGGKAKDAELLEQLTKANQGPAAPRSLTEWQREKMKG